MKSEVTGVITTFDQTNHVFRIQVDGPPRLFTIAVRRDCKFIKNGTPAGEQILRKGARVRVSYFATIFTGKIAVKIESNTAPGVRPVSFYRGSTRNKRARLSLLQAIADEYKKTT